MYSETLCATVCGIDGCVVRVEADVSDGLPCFSLVGFLAAEVKEARERVRIALKNSGFRFPPKRITINLAPADVRKDGTGYDLAIAIAILTAFGYLSQEVVKHVLFIGELSLDGELKPVKGILPMVYTAYENELEYCIVPMENEKEAMVVEGITVIGVRSLKEVMELLQEECLKDSVSVAEKENVIDKEFRNELDFSDVCGQEGVKRAIEVAVAGMHNLLIMGPPGTGKSMLAKRISGIMPELSFEERMEISKIYSVAGLLSKELPIISKRPFRTPHHTITQTALVGGGRVPKPGEISLASGGVLFLDELPEFQRQTIEVLRQPLEDGYINVTRLDGSYRYPANFQLICAMNLCPCGKMPDRKACMCTPLQIKNYLGKVSQPLLDRIDICTETIPLRYKEVQYKKVTGESTKAIRERVVKAQKRQRERYKKESFLYNASLNPSGIDRYCRMSADAEKYIGKVFDELEFSARAYHKILKVARTIADLEGEEFIKQSHISEAVCYRRIDRKYWNA